MSKLTKLQQIEKVIETLSADRPNVSKACLMLEKLKSDLVRQNPDTNNEWGTPPEIIKLVHEFYGCEIELDPASSKSFCDRIKATKYYSKDDDALTKFWKANTLFCNPPYGKLAKHFVNKCMSSPSVKEAIFLLNRTGAAWYVDTLAYSGYWTSICNVRKRIAFVDEHGIVQTSPRYYNDIIYHGPHNGMFQEVFSAIGNVRRLC